MKTTRYTIIDLNQQELSVSTTTAPMATMTKNLFGIRAMSKKPSSGEWPDGTDFTATGRYGRYIDIPLNEAAREFGFYY